MLVIVIGCGRVGSTLVRQLLNAGQEVVVVDDDPLRLESIQDLDCIQVVGLPIDLDVLRKAGIEAADALCACSSSENVNIMVAEIAVQIFGVEQVYLRSFNPANTDSLRRMGLGVISGTELIVNGFCEALALPKMSNNPNPAPKEDDL